jgi:DNA-binding response OmpR family regulator
MILICDDEHALVQFCREILQPAGYEVRTAHNAEEAYRHLRDPSCKGMLLDLWMPDFNGAALLMLMAADGLQTPVIVFADDPSFEEDELREFPNVRRLLKKPFYPEDLLAAVREHMPKA